MNIAGTVIALLAVGLVALSAYRGIKRLRNGGGCGCGGECGGKCGCDRPGRKCRGG